jgi:hypothetical protein
VALAGTLVVAFVLAVSFVLVFFAEPQPLTTMRPITASGQTLKRSGLDMERAYWTSCV